ncbi:hypothetical protein GQ43DRAFT_159309 [Delitschia confertaspora ATCC 74209]|uniref:Alpha N-terminal protein methyltransferase 1 n=1 Tax=Delitschia confertaspora ATCC 74209 TaxID=1513339 RepID=A0A9P4N3L2_9PLEO|nr:hypothetical protein GQ43DRAFT_159309 [Delitschia confertaspora ATCC 74209]
MAGDMRSSPPILPSTSNPDAAINHETSINYWSSVSSDVNGMLGGFPQTSRIDLQGSANFLAKLRRKHKQVQQSRSQTEGGITESTSVGQELGLMERVADCGAGIGRITKGFLLGVGKSVDVVEPVKKFTDELVKSLDEEKEENGSKSKGEVNEVINLGLQDWTPSPGKYNLIWNQWCLGHLTDAQLVAYLKRCKDGLVDSSSSTEAWIVVKENMASGVQDIYDEEDSSVTRTDQKFRKLFSQAGLQIVATEVQRGFPRELFAVRMYALRPE